MSESVYTDADNLHMLAYRDLTWRFGRRPVAALRHMPPVRGRGEVPRVQDLSVTGFRPCTSSGWPARPHLGERWPSRLVATAFEDRLSIKRNPHTSFAAASDCRTDAIYEYAPFCNGPGDVKSPRVVSRRRAHASVRGRRRGRHTMLSEGTVSLSRYAWFVG